MLLRAVPGGWAPADGPSSLHRPSSELPLIHLDPGTNLQAEGHRTSAGVRPCHHRWRPKGGGCPVMARCQPGSVRLCWTARLAPLTLLWTRRRYSNVRPSEHPSRRTLRCVRVRTISRHASRTNARVRRSDANGRRPRLRRRFLSGTIAQAEGYGQAGNNPRQGRGRSCRLDSACVGGRPPDALQCQG